MKKETIKNKDGSLTTIIDHDLEDGLKISSLNQRIYLSKYNGYRAYDEQFFWLYMEYSNLLNIENYDLEKQDITRLIYIACFIGNNGYLTLYMRRSFRSTAKETFFLHRRYKQNYFQHSLV